MHLVIAGRASAAARKRPTNAMLIDDVASGGRNRGHAHGCICAYGKRGQKYFILSCSPRPLPCLLSSPMTHRHLLEKVGWADSAKAEPRNDLSKIGTCSSTSISKPKAPGICKFFRCSTLPEKPPSAALIHLVSTMKRPVASKAGNGKFAGALMVRI